MGDDERRETFRERLNRTRDRWEWIAWFNLGVSLGAALNMITDACPR